MDAIPKKDLERFHVSPGEKVDLADLPTSWLPPGLESLDMDSAKAACEEFLKRTIDDISASQNLLYASDTYALLLIFQAMDAAGKDSTIKHVMTGVNPQGCHVTSFKAPSAQELDHDFLWRCVKELPERGKIGIFNRSYYEEVLVTRVHPELIRAQRIPGLKKIKRSFWRRRFNAIRAFEKHLVRSGTVILKFFLHVSKEEQKKRFLERIDDPAKHWKFSSRDVEERGRWGDYMEAYQDAIEQTSTEWAPWYVIPADRKWVMRALVAEIVSSTIQKLDLSYPRLGEEEVKTLERCKSTLLSETD